MLIFRIYIKKSICSILLLISLLLLCGFEIAAQDSSQVNVSLQESQDRFRSLEKTLIAFKKMEATRFQKQVAEYIHLALELKIYDKAARMLILVLERFQSLRDLEAYLQLCHRLESSFLNSTKVTVYLPKFYLSMATAYRGLRKKEDQIRYYSKVIEINSPQDSLVTAQALYIRGQSYSFSGKFLAALEDYVLSATYFDQLKDPFGAINVEEGVLLLLRRNGFGNEVIPRRLKLIEKIQELQRLNLQNKLPINLPLEYLNLALDYQVAGNLSLYEQYLLQAIEEANKPEYTPSAFEFLFISCYAELADLYLKKDLIKAAAYLKKVESYITPGRYPKHVYHLIVYAIKKVKLLLAQQQYTTALRQLEDLAHRTTIREAKQLREVYELLSEVYAIKQNSKKALTYYTLYQKLNDSIFGASKANALIYYQTLYDTEKKEKEITSQELELQSQQYMIASKKRQQYYYMIGSILLIGLLIGTFLFMKRVRKEKKKVADSLFEKELLLKEIHHRVKNNLQIVYGLLYKQSRRSNDRAFKILMEDAQSRIKSMAIIHEKLYQNQSFSEVDMKGYVSELIKDIEHSYAKTSTIRVELDMAITRFHMDIAIPLGLILNELITNVFKHAFPNGTGHIFVSLHKINGKHEIKVKDNGIGLPEDLNLKKSSSLGMNLIVGLCHQIRASFEYHNNNGSEFTITLSAS